MRVLAAQLMVLLSAQVVDCAKPNEITASLGPLLITGSLGIDADPEGVGPWTKVELPGTQCSDGSQYKFFVSRSQLSDDLLVIFEPGGACWDYASCAGDSLRGAANPNGIPDNHMDLWQHVHPHAGGLFGQAGQFVTWNKVFVPYCTGDVHSGSRVVTYQSEAGDTLEYRHVGFDNMQRVSDFVAANFPGAERMAVTGCSAGGTGALLNYPLLRQRMVNVQHGYLLDDSGPIFPSEGRSGPLHDRIREAWNTDAIITAYGELIGPEAAARVRADFGAINTVIADAYPTDRLALIAFQRDLNYSLYSYDTFYAEPPYPTLTAYWEEDLAAIRAQFETRTNLAYYLPFFRPDNCSHCATIIPTDRVSEVAIGLVSPWAGTQIEAARMTLPAFIDLVLDDDQPLVSYSASDTSNGFTSEQIAQCRM